MLIVYASNIRASKYMKLKLIELNKSTIAIIDFNTPLSIIVRLCRKSGMIQKT